MLCTINLYCVLCQLYLNKTEGKKVAEFYTLILYPATFLNFLIRSNSFLVVYLGFLEIISCHLQIKAIWHLPFQERKSKVPGLFPLHIVFEYDMVKYHQEPGKCMMKTMSEPPLERSLCLCVWVCTCLSHSHTHNLPLPRKQILCKEAGT